MAATLSYSDGIIFCIFCSVKWVWEDRLDDYLLFICALQILQCQTLKEKKWIENFFICIVHLPRIVSIAIPWKVHSFQILPKPCFNVIQFVSVSSWIIGYYQIHSYKLKPKTWNDLSAVFFPWKKIFCADETCINHSEHQIATFHHLVAL